VQGEAATHRPPSLCRLLLLYHCQSLEPPATVGLINRLAKAIEGSTTCFFTMSLSLTPAGISPAASITLARSIPSTSEELANMSPFELFQIQMSEGNTEAQVDAMKRLPVVAYAIGPAKTISDLVPFLQHLSQQGLEDELLLLLAKQMQTFVPNLLTTHDSMISLLPILERLAAVEETVVRDQSVVCFNHICDHFKTPLEPATISSLVSMTKRLVGADWFTAKVSVSGMLPTLHKLTKNSEIPYLYKELCLDETPMVRRAASLHLGHLLASLEDPGCDLIHILQQLCKDEQDSVRMLAVSSLASVGPSYGTTPDFTQATFLPILKAGSTDMSWYVQRDDSDLFVGGVCFDLCSSEFHLNRCSVNLDTSLKTMTALFDDAGESAIIWQRISLMPLETLVFNRTLPNTARICQLSWHALFRSWPTRKRKFVLLLSRILRKWFTGVVLPCSRHICCP